MNHNVRFLKTIRSEIPLWVDFRQLAMGKVRWSWIAQAHITRSIHLNFPENASKAARSPDIAPPTSEVVRTSPCHNLGLIQWHCATTTALLSGISASWNHPSFAR